nr:MAG TPA: hypothetical protein [Caudoviricetes sp.]
MFRPWVLISMFFMTTPPSVPKVGFAVCRPVAVHGGDGLFAIFAVDDGVQRLLASCGFCVVFGRRELLRVQIRLGAGVLGVHGIHVILRLGTDAHAAAVLAVKTGVKFQFPIYQIGTGGFDLPQAGNGGDFILPLLLCADTGFALLQQSGHDLRLCGFDGGKSRFVGAVHNQISGGLAVFVEFQGNPVPQNQFLCVHVLFLLFKNFYGVGLMRSNPPEALLLLSAGQLCRRSGHAILGGADAVRLAVGVGHRVVPKIVRGEGVRCGLAVKPCLPAEVGSPYCVSGGIKSLFHDISLSAAVRLHCFLICLYITTHCVVCQEKIVILIKNISRTETVRDIF